MLSTSLEEKNSFLEEWRPVFSYDPETAEKALLHAADSAQAVGDNSTEFMLMDELAWQAVSRNDETVALSYIHRALRLAENFKTTKQIGLIRNTYGIFYMNRGEFFAAIEEFKQALNAYEECNREDKSMAIVANIGEMLVEMDEFEFAAPYIKESIRLAGSNPSVDILLNYPYILIHEGQIKKAWNEIVRAWRISRQTNNQLQRAQTHEIAGWVQNTQKHTKAALRHYYFSVKLFQMQSDHFHIASVYQKIGDIYLKLELLSEAAEFYRQSADIAGFYDYHKIEIQTLQKLLLLSSGPIEALVVQQRLQKVLYNAREHDKKFQSDFVQIHIQNKLIRKKRLDLELVLERDKLTGLVSYRILSDHLNQMVIYGKFLFLFCDVDRLKYINDKYGHIAGDTLLKQFAKDIEKSLPENGVAIRKCGDEFIILLPFSDEKLTIVFLEEFYERLAQKHHILEEELSLSCSIGIAAWPQDTDKIEKLEKLADDAMYYSKLKGRNKASWYRDIESRSI